MPCPRGDLEGVQKDHTMHPFDSERALRHAQDAIRDTEHSAERLITESFADLWRAFEMVRDAFQNGGHLHVCGNGGSAADAPLARPRSTTTAAPADAPAW